MEQHMRYTVLTPKGGEEEFVVSTGGSEQIRVVRRLLNSIGNDSDQSVLERFTDAAQMCTPAEQRDVAEMVGKVAMSRVGRRITVFEDLAKVAVERTARRSAYFVLLIGARKGVPFHVMEDAVCYRETFGSILLYEIAQRALSQSSEGFIASTLLARVVVRSALHHTILCTVLRALSTSPAMLKTKFNHLSVLLEQSQGYLLEIGVALRPLHTSLNKSLPCIADPIAQERVTSVIKRIEVSL